MSTPRIVIAPDSFKGSLTAAAVADSIAEGVRRACPHADIERVPMADGGEGTVQALAAATDGTLVTCEVTDPMGRRIEAEYGLLGDIGADNTEHASRAVIEMAAASGLPLVPESDRDIFRASTTGTGQLLRDALDRGCRQLLIGIGGSATNDCGAGCLHALGVRFFDAGGRELSPVPADLERLARIDADGLDPRIAECSIMVACDVDNPLLGDEGASAVFGPQKGASSDDVQRLDAILARMADITTSTTGRDVRDHAGAGAAGGLGFALMAWCNAQLTRGIDLVIDAVDLDGRMREANMCITGEGRLDAQSVMGKTISGVARVARQHCVPVVALAGGLADDVHRTGNVLDAYLSIVDRPMTLDDAFRRAPALLSNTAEQVMRLYLLGRHTHQG